MALCTSIHTSIHIQYNIQYSFAITTNLITIKNSIRLTTLYDTVKWGNSPGFPGHVLVSDKNMGLCL